MTNILDYPTVATKEVIELAGMNIDQIEMLAGNVYHEFVKSTEIDSVTTLKRLL